MDDTRLRFKVTPDGQWSAGDAQSMLGGMPLFDGQRVSLGKHRFVIAHPAAETFSTNLFIWYGGLDLGTIALRRTRGNLALHIEPPAADAWVKGAEFSTTLAASAGQTSAIPTGDYEIHARWANFEQTLRVTIQSNRTSNVQLAPPLGALTIDTDPPGAWVTGSNGRTVGRTPMMLPEVRAGPWTSEVRLDGYIPIELKLEISANQTNSVRTNLVNWQYTQAADSARQSFAQHDYNRASDAVTAALRIKPNDADLLALQKQITLAGHMQRASAFVTAGDYAAAHREVEAVLAANADSEEAKGLLADIDKRQQDLAAQQEQKRQADAAAQQAQVAKQQAQAAAQQAQAAAKQDEERLRRLPAVLASACARHFDADLFNTHEMTASMGVKEIQRAITDALRTFNPPFEITNQDWPDPDTFAVEAKQKAFGGFRECVIAGAKANASQTKISFKVLEYETHMNLNLGGFVHLTEGGQAPVVAVHPKRVAQWSRMRENRIREGVAIVTACMKIASGQGAAGGQ